jgi:hypothetical protein
LSGHPNIIQYLSAAYVDKSRSGHACGEYLLITELCTGELLFASSNASLIYEQKIIV